MKKYIIFCLALMCLFSATTIKAHFIDGNFNHHAHVSEGNPLKAKSVEGFTTWPKTYHYTVAELQDRNGNVMSTSQRIWGTEKTSAYTSYYGLTTTFARTFYGK